jgi:hypothetical protein
MSAIESTTDRTGDEHGNHCTDALYPQSYYILVLLGYERLIQHLTIFQLHSRGQC